MHPFRSFAVGVNFGVALAGFAFGHPVTGVVNLVVMLLLMAPLPMWDR